MNGKTVVTRLLLAVYVFWTDGVMAEQTAPVTPNAPLRLAILPTDPLPETRSLADLLPLELQKTDVEIVERVELERREVTTLLSFGPEKQKPCV